MFANSLLLPALLVILFALLARAASLADFKPRVSDLTGKCFITYHKSISGCSGADFTSGNCSAKCIDGLVDLAPTVKEDCSDAGVDNNSIIGIFLAGQGPSILCPNAASAASSLSTAAPSTTSIVVRSSTLDLTTTPPVATSILVDTSLPPTTTLSIVMPSSLSTSAIASTTAVATEPGTLVTSTTSAPATTETTTSSNGNGNGNGGGDPFNLFNASPPSTVLSTWLLATSLAVCAFLAHISF
ncbi:hypothetical protein IWZ00DRAFT_545310 [Phyllosticta capitalensis]